MAKKSGAKKQTNAEKADAVAATATETVGAPATDTLAPPAPVTDEQIQNNGHAVKAAGDELDELTRLRQQLEQEHQARVAAERQATAVEQKLVRVNDGTANILVRERICRQKYDELVDITEKQKQAKKAYDASVTDLRKSVGDLLDGQMNLFTAGEIAGDVANAVAPAPVQTPGAKKSNRKKPAADAAPGTVVEQEPTAVAQPSGEVPADARDDEKGSVPTPASIPQPAQGWWMDTNLGSVSVLGEQAGQMRSITPTLVKAMAEAGVVTVAQAQTAFQRSTPIKGLSAPKRKEVSGIVAKWIDTEGGDRPGGGSTAAVPGLDAAAAATVPPAANTTAANPQNWTSLQRLCGACQHRWALPSTVKVCPQCNEQRLLYDVGYHQNVNADADGDLVAAIEVVPFTVPETAETKGLGEYQFRIMLAPDGGGQFVAGYEIGMGADIAEHHYPNIKDPRLSKQAATEHGLHLLNQAVLGVFASRQAHEQWLTAAEQRVGVKPVNHSAL